MRTYLFGLHWHTMIMLVAPLDTFGSCVVSAGTNMHYIQEYLNRALGYCPDVQIMIGGIKQAYKKEDEALQRLVKFQGAISLMQTVKHF